MHIHHRQSHHHGLIAGEQYWNRISKDLAENLLIS
jgi:hypothetical protein